MPTRQKIKILAAVLLLLTICLVGQVKTQTTQYELTKKELEIDSTDWIGFKFPDISTTRINANFFEIPDSLLKIMSTEELISVSYTWPYFYLYALSSRGGNHYAIRKYVINGSKSLKVLLKRNNAGTELLKFYFSVVSIKYNPRLDTTKANIIFTKTLARDCYKLLLVQKEIWFNSSKRNQVLFAKMAYNYFLTEPNDFSKKLLESIIFFSDPKNANHDVLKPIRLDLKYNSQNILVKIKKIITLLEK